MVGAWLFAKKISSQCPVFKSCVARKDEVDLILKSKKAKKENLTQFLVIRSEDRFLLEQRCEKASGLDYGLSCSETDEKLSLDKVKYW